MAPGCLVRGGEMCRCCVANPEKVVEKVAQRGGGGGGGYLDTFFPDLKKVMAKFS